MLTIDVTGLTVGETLVGIANTRKDPNVVVTLATIECGPDGHWLVPDPYLPCLCNDDLVQGLVLLSQGISV